MHIFIHLIFLFIPLLPIHSQYINSDTNHTYAEAEAFCNSIGRLPTEKDNIRPDSSVWLRKENEYCLAINAKEQIQHVSCNEELGVVCIFESFVHSNRQFHVIQQNKTFEDASNYCRENWPNSRLVHINDEGVQSIILLTLYTKKSKSSKFWIDQEGIAPREKTRFENFKEFHKIQRPNEKCAAINYQPSGVYRSGDWSWEDCAKEYQFICEVRVQENKPNSLIIDHTTCLDEYYKFDDKCYRLFYNHDMQDKYLNRSIETFDDAISKECHVENVKDPRLVSIKADIQMAILKTLMDSFKISRTWVDGKFNVETQMFEWSDQKAKTQMRTLTTVEDRLLQQPPTSDKYQCLSMDQRSKDLILGSCHQANIGYLCEYTLDQQDSEGHSVETANLACPGEWVKIGHNCFSPPIQGLDEFSWSEKFCWNILDLTIFPDNANILSFASALEEAEFMKYIKEKNPTVSEIWLGFSFKHVTNGETKWFWLDGTPITYTNFAMGPPWTLANGTDEESVACLVLDLASSKWQQKDCSSYSKEIATVCKVPAFDDKILSTVQVNRQDFTNTHGQTFFTVPPGAGLLADISTDLNTLICKHYNARPFIVEDWHGLQMVQQSLTAPYLIRVDEHMITAVENDETPVGHVYCADNLMLGCFQRDTRMMKEYNPILCTKDAHSPVPSLTQVYSCPQPSFLIGNECVFVSSSREKVAPSSANQSCSRTLSGSQLFHSTNEYLTTLLAGAILIDPEDTSYWVDSHHGPLTNTIYDRKNKMQCHVLSVKGQGSKAPISCLDKHRFICSLKPVLAGKESDNRPTLPFLQTFLKDSDKTIPHRKCLEGYFEYQSQCYRLVQDGQCASKDRVLSWKNVESNSQLSFLRLLAIGQVGWNQRSSIRLDSTGFTNDIWVSEILLKEINTLLLDRLDKKGMYLSTSEPRINFIEPSMATANDTKILTPCVYSLEERPPKEAGAVQSLITRAEFKHLCPHENAVLFNGSTCIWLANDGPMPMYTSLEVGNGHCRSADPDSVEATLFVIPDQLSVDDYEGLMKEIARELGAESRAVIGLKMLRSSNMTKLQWADNADTSNRPVLFTNSPAHELCFELNTKTGLRPNNCIDMASFVCQSPVKNVCKLKSMIKLDDTNFSCFEYLAKAPKDHLMAEQSCNELDSSAHLVSIHSKEQFDKILNQLPANAEAWIGLEEIYKTFRWHDHSLIDFIIADSAKNDLSNDGERLCYSINKNESRIKPRNCNDTLPFICGSSFEKATKQRSNAYEKIAYCPEGYSLYGNKCFKLFKSSVTYESAGLKCKAETGINPALAIPETMGENYFIESLLYDVSSSRVSKVGFPSVWINHSIYFTNFYARQEYSSGSPNTCVSMLRSMDPMTNGRWYIDSCATQLDGFVCQMDSSPVALVKYPENPNCPQGFLKHPAKNVCYHSLSEYQPYELASSNCRLMNSKLLIINDPFEAAFVKSIMTKYSIARAWLDARIEPTEKTSWEWTDERPIKYTDLPRHTLKETRDQKSPTHLFFQSDVNTHAYHFATGHEAGVDVICQLDDSATTNSYCLNDSLWASYGHGNRTLSWSKGINEKFDLGWPKRLTKDNRKCQRWDLNIDALAAGLLSASFIANGEGVASYAENYCSFVMRLNEEPKYGCYIDGQFHDCQFESCSQTPIQADYIKRKGEKIGHKSHQVAITFLLLILAVIAGALLMFVLKKKRQSSVGYTHPELSDGFDNPGLFEDPPVSYFVNPPEGPDETSQTSNKNVFRAGTLHIHGVNSFLSNTTSKYTQLNDENC